MLLQILNRTRSRLAALKSRPNNVVVSSVRTPTLHNFSRPCNSFQTTLIVNRTMATGLPNKHTNRLSQEKSPYLLQHAHNPVDWYPWSDEAIQKARDENKLIFLSVGYSTCHWCHVMEHESFENPEVAKIMNENFVNIKVDREERPDIDKIYMNFVVMMNGSGGWPMSVWLTPDLAPITAGTYFPPKSRWGMPGFTTVLQTIAAKWKTDQRELAATGLKVIEGIRSTLTQKTTEGGFEPGSAEAKLHEAVRIFKYKFDDQFGGFGDHPKFPEVSRLNFLFHAYIVSKDEDILDMATKSLRKIGNGGIHDHVFGGFARYSVDRKWHVPHFEKMLYDQGQLMSAYSNAFMLTQDRKFLNFADGIFRYIMKDLRHLTGGFFSGEDADSLPTAGDTVKVEGAFYAWTWSEIRNAIAENIDKYSMTEDEIFKVYCHHYDVREAGNVEPSSDPHGHLLAKNILIVRKSLAETCDKFQLSTEQLTEVLRTTNEILHEIRDKRPRPHLDTKIITSWNGLILSGLANLANCGNEKREEYMKAAGDLYQFSRNYLFDKERKVLLRSCYGEGAELAEILSQRIDGFLDDYSFLIQGLLDYYKASLNPEVLDWARELQDIQDQLFWDNKDGGYFYSHANSPNVVVRLKEDSDGAEPCGNSVAASNLILLSYYFDDDNLRQKANKLFDYFSSTDPFGYVLPKMMSGLLLNELGLDLVAVVGPDTEVTKQFVEILQRFYIPGMIIVHVDPEKPSASCLKTQEKFKMVNGKPTVYICHDKVCRMPLTDPKKLEENLNENFLTKG